MRPRQNLKDFRQTTSSLPHQNHNHNHHHQPAYQSVNHHNVTLRHPTTLSMAPPPQPTPMSAGQSSAQQQSSLPQPDLIAELIRLGLNPEEMAKQSNRNSQGREEMFKNLQAILGKRDISELLHKMPSNSNNDWSTTSSASSSQDFQRSFTGSSGANGGGRRDSVIGSGPTMSGGGMSGGGPVSFNNNTNNTNASQQHEQDIQYASAQQQQQQHPAAVASTINHHHFRIPTTNAAMHNSPLQQQQQLLSQHKSVLSLHHQQHHQPHHQNDPTQRQRLNHQSHKLNSVPNSSIANLNDMSGGLNSSSSTPSSSALLDPKISPLFNHNKSSPALSSYTINTAGVSPRVPNLIDAIGGQPSLDNMHDNSPFHQTATMNSRDKLKSLVKHQHLQKQLRTKVDKQNNFPWPNRNTSSNSSLITDIQQRVTGNNIISSSSSSSSSSGLNNNSMSQLQLQMTSSLSSAISPPQTTPVQTSMPKSLLNLAAFSTSPPTANNANQMASNKIVANQISSTRNVGTNHSVPNSGSVGGSRLGSRNNSSNGSISQKVPITGEQSNLLQQMIARSSTSNRNQATSLVQRPNYSNLSLSSLLSEEQPTNSRGVRPSTNQANLSNVRTNTLTNQQALKRPSSAKSDDSYGSQTKPNSKKSSYLAYLQERAAKAGVSIGEINLPIPNPTTEQSNQQSNDFHGLSPAQPEVHDTNEVEIETALTQVEARNDLSLLYPPVSLATNSQKQINSLSAGFGASEDPDIITDEVKKMVQEGCNIIYECKTCSNLFRSLANLVKHKRLYCKENNTDLMQMELTRRSNVNAIPTQNMSVTKAAQDMNACRSAVARSCDESGNSLLAEPRQPDNLNRRPDVSANSTGTQKYNLRGKRVDVSCLTGDMRTNRSTRNQDKSREQTSPNTAGQTNLSRLLQNQPKSRQTPMKDSALLDALSMGHTLSVSSSRGSVIKNPIGGFNEQFVRNSSLAKTLLSENVKSLGVSTSNPEFTSISVSTSPAQNRPVAPKRKFLEDCIRKVKRDKLGPSDTGDSEPSQASNASDLDTASVEKLQDQFKDPLDIDDSGADSDALVMDIEDTTYTQTARAEKKSSKRFSERVAASPVQAASKLNSSSALLKALTRPVETRSSYTATSQKVDIIKHATRSCDSTGAETTSPSMNKNNQTPLSESTGLQLDKLGDKSKQDDQTLNTEVIPSSPILERYNCGDCQMDFSDHPTLLSHIMGSHKDVKRIHPCMLCSLTFISMENICRHIMDFHKKTKAQVSRLKDVVESRSYLSKDFAGCIDLPAGYKLEAEDNETNSSKNQLTSDALSDLAATQQILDDTVALVSMASSPTKSGTITPVKRLPSLVARSSSRLAAKKSPSVATTEKEVPSNDQLEGFSSAPLNSSKEVDASPDSAEVDDVLSDSMIPSISDEHLAILEKQEAEIEAERLRNERNSSNLKVISHDDYSADQSDDIQFQEDDVQLHQTDSPTNDQCLEDESQEGDLTVEDDIDQWKSTPNEQNNGEKTVIDDCLSSQDGIDLANADEESGDSQSTQEEPTRSIISRGKHIVAPLCDVNQQEELEPKDEDTADDDEEGQIQDETDWNQQGASSSLSDSSSSGDSESSESSDLSDSEAVSSDGDNNLQGADEEDDTEANNQGVQYEGSQNVAQEDLSDDSQPMSVINVKRKGSHSGSIKSETDISLSEAGGKTSKQDYYDVSSSCSSSKLPLKSSATTMDGTGGCKLKLKSAASSSYGRDVGGGGNSSNTNLCSSNANVNSSSTSSGGSGGGIMKLKIQLKTQPDEKSKVYRIVE